jgi:signal transduction histidine kinase
MKPSPDLPPPNSRAVPTSASTSGRATPRWRSAFAALTLRGVAWAVSSALIGAMLLNPIFEIPFPVLLGRTVFVALTVLLAFGAARHWRWGLMPQWVAQTIAVGVTAPVATGLMYWLASGGDWLAFVGDPGRVTGFAFISVSALVIGLVLGLGTLLREREAQARNLALAFELEREQLERAAVDARLALLTAQIEPHFLFNTLANVQALVESGSPQAAAVLRSLIAYLRAALPRLHEAGLPSLADELALVRAYLELMHMRLPDRLRFEIDIAAELMALRFPPMALLTLVENAVRHGIDPSEDGGTICVGGQFDDQGRVRLWVADSGVGIAESTRTGTGLANLRGRLQGLFGASAQLDLSEQSPSGVRAEISFKPLSERVVAT